MQKNYFLNVKRTRTTGLKMAAVKFQHKNFLQSTLRKKIINTLFAGLGESLLGKTVSEVLSTAQFFPIRTKNMYTGGRVLTR